MKSSILYGLILAFFCLSFGKLKAQSIETDSLALLCIYLDLNGDDWQNNLNWTSNEPVGTWHGVTVENNRVTRLELPNNNLRGTISGDFANLTALEFVDLGLNEIDALNLPLFDFFFLDTFSIRDNNLTSFPTMTTAIFAEMDMRKNNLDFGDIETLEFSSAADFTFQPQDTFGFARTKYISPGADLTLFSFPFNGSSNNYTWYKDGNPIQTTQTLNLSSSTGDLEGVYDLKVTSSVIPGVQLNQGSVTVSVLAVDSLGGEYINNQLIIEFADDATQFEKDTLLDWYGATRLDTCLCGIIELWELPDTSFLNDGNIVIGVEETKNDARQKPKVEETGNNYVTDLLSFESSYRSGNYFPNQAAPSPPFGGGPIRVAIIDGGIDYNHPMLSGYFWENNDEVSDDLQDNDGNCLADDFRGYDLANRENDPNDDTDSGHGTHVAGIVTENLLDFKLDMMNIKSHDFEGFGTLFNGVCGIYYARDQEANVINLSWGYEGVASLVLENSIIRAGELCNALVVSSAGNSGSNNDLRPHYPSSYEMDNLISVGALNLMEDDIAPFSNYGIESVDLLAPGTRIFSTVPGGTQAFKDGTSMAAANISGLAAEIMYEHPNLSYLDVKRAIFETVEFMPPVDSVLLMGKVDRLEALAYADTITVSDFSCLITNTEAPIPNQISGVQVFPQPFQGSVVFEFELKQAIDAQLLIFDAMGRIVDRIDGQYSAGSNQVIWTAGYHLPKGMYFYSIRGENLEWSGKLMKQ